jgi:pilus assembly protein Flp/PilA
MSDLPGPSVSRSQHERKGTDMDQWLRDEQGQGLVEYALIIAMIAVAIVGAMSFLQGQLQNIFSNIGNNLT